MSRHLMLHMAVARKENGREEEGRQLFLPMLAGKRVGAVSDGVVREKTTLYKAPARSSAGRNNLHQ
jgi:hypothetical protein